MPHDLCHTAKHQESCVCFLNMTEPQPALARTCLQCSCTLLTAGYRYAAAKLLRFCQTSCQNDLTPPPLPKKTS
jgi:hypothetical protein